MGWGRMMLLGNVGQQLDVDDLNRSIEEMRLVVKRNEITDEKQAERLWQLKQENHELKLYLATLIRLLVSKGVLKQEEVETIVRAVESDAQENKLRRQI